MLQHCEDFKASSSSIKSRLLLIGKGNALQLVFSLCILFASFNVYLSSKPRNSVNDHVDISLSDIKRKQRMKSSKRIDEKAEDSRSLALSKNESIASQMLSNPTPINIENNLTIDASDYDLMPNSTYAYCFLMVGCDAKYPQYLGFLYNILISARILRQSGSEADVVVLARMSRNSTENVLPENQSQWLRALGIRVKYLEKPTEEETFNESQMLKFRILDLVEYKRVLYLDSDVMPFCSMDYIFKLSEGENATIKENLIVAWNREPAWGGYFMLKPGKGEWDQVQDIIAKQRESAKDLPFPHFDPEVGWGHVIGTYGKQDRWNALTYRRGGRLWMFYAAYTDQGLLYYWTKYAKKSVTIVMGKGIENWAPAENNTAKFEGFVEQPFAKHYCRPRTGGKQKLRWLKHPAYGSFRRMHPYSDFIHFYAKFKPWHGDPEPAVKKRIMCSSARQYWFFELRRLNEELRMGIDFDKWSGFTSPLGDNRVPLMKHLLRNQTNSLPDEDSLPSGTDE